MDDVSECDFDFAGDALSAHIESLEAIDDEKDGEPDGEDRLVAQLNRTGLLNSLLRWQMMYWWALRCLTLSSLQRMWTTGECACAI